MSNVALSGKLYAFLKKEGLIRKFKANCDRISSTDNVIGAFDWYKTKEGFDFWLGVHDRFEEYLNTEKAEQNE